MIDYVYAIYSYLLDIELFFKGQDSEVINIIGQSKKAVDKYVASPNKDTFEDVNLIINYFYDDRGQIKPKYRKVSNSINNLSEMIYRTKQILYFMHGI